jgi:type III restriction enzyme
MGLVKQISVSSNQVETAFNKPYIKLLTCSNDGGYKAKIEIDASIGDGKVARKTITVKPGSDLFVLSKERELYDGYVVNGITTGLVEKIEFANEEVIGRGKSIGDVDELQLKRAQIRRTIEFHLDKEMQLNKKGIKVLSLFFIDEVANYRKTDGTKGEYAKIFEEEYEKLISRYPELNFDKNCHNGYFSQDKKGNLKNTRGDTADDFTIYQTIMQKKEWLLSFECPLRFIFSHSALKEGWDNPNVFQVCTLIDQKSAFTARQKIGRGLRLCVNQDGERIEDKDINQLHIIANESFADFADSLQKEIEQETGVKFGYLQLSLLDVLRKREEKTISIQVAEQIEMALEKSITEIIEKEPERVIELAKQIDESIAEIKVVDGEVKVVQETELTYEEKVEVIEKCEENGYTKKGKIQNTLKEALANNTLNLNLSYEMAVDRFENVVKQADMRPPIRDASRDVKVRIRKGFDLNPAFVELWDKISQKTTYRVNIDTDTLVERSVASLKKMEKLPKARIVSRTGGLKQDYTAGIGINENEFRTIDIESDDEFLPNLLAVASEQCMIKRNTVMKILEKADRLDDFIRNPQLFIEKFIEIVKFHRHNLAIDGISYIKLDGEHYYSQEIFDSEELLANLDKNAISVENSIYDHVIYDSSVEKSFAQKLDEDKDVKMFFKLPKSRFKIDTPIGEYTPDWAVYFTKNGEEKLYFVIETKGNESMFDLRTNEQLRIHCGKVHFDALGGANYKLATDWDKVKMEA